MVLFYLRCWVGLVGSIAVLNGVYGYYDSSSAGRKIYTEKPKEAGPLFGRMFSNWTILAGVLRVGFALSVAPGLSLYLATLFSFLLAFGHFFTEVFFTRTAPLHFPTISPLILAGVSSVWMLFQLPAIL